MKNNGINITEWVSALSNQKLFYLAVINKSGQLTFTNSHFFKTLHLTSEALINTKFPDFLHPSDRAAFNNALELADHSHTAVGIELRIKNGHYRWVKWEISRFRNGKTAGETFLCLGYDIPCEDQIKKYVSITEQNCQAIVENLNVGIIFQDKHGAVISANQKLAAIFDTTLENIYSNKRLYSLWKTTDEDGNPLSFRDAPFMKALATGEVQTNIELNLEISEGKYRSVICNSQPLFEKGQTEPFSVVSTILDITNEKKLEAESKRKGILLQEEKLKQQKGIAEAIIQTQEEERTRIGHELHDNINQILSSSLLFIGLMDPAKDNYEEIKEKAKETVMLGIEEIRKLSKEMVAPSLRDNGLIESIHIMIDELRLIKPFEIFFTYDSSCDIETLSKNKKLTIFRIIQEQVKNIIKYSKAQNVTISLSCSNDQLRLLIEDDGVGFDSGNTRRGLGLSNIYERTRLENGKVMLDTASGKGCSLKVNIPLEYNKPL